jgi:4-aminobutyrate aminotransferase-like enzyme
MEYERIVTAIPGPRSREFAELIARYEARGVTYLGDDYPVTWAEAHGALVTDVDGNRYFDLTGAFAVAALGHTNDRVRDAIVAQASRLIHGMGDVHPTDVKARLLERLAALAPGECCKTYFGCNGGDAIEFALKTAYLATGRARALAFEGAYHGLSLGALPVTGIARFRDPFAPLLPPTTSWLPFPDATFSLEAALADIERALDEDREIGAVVVEPIQGRGGVIVPPAGFLRGLRELCDRFAAVLIFDEIYTGFGRTGTLWACEREGVVPDIICIGKAIAGGVPLSAAIGTPAVMDAWPASTGEALHTATFLGNPLACAAALAVCEAFADGSLVAGAAAREAELRRRLGAMRILEARGRGMLWALEFGDAARANRIVRSGLQRGLILLQSGTNGTSITLAPPLVIADDQLDRALDLLAATIEETP